MIIAIAAASLINVSISAAQTALGIGVLMLLVFREVLPPTRIWVPLLFFFLWTVLADLLSPNPWGGLPQIRKFFDFFFLLLMYSAFSRQFQKIYYLITAWGAAATASALWGFVQYGIKYLHAKHIGADFYLTYLARRITGFQGHWMTFGGLQLGAFALLVAHAFFAGRKMPRWAYGSIAVSLGAILLAWDRGIWIATVACILYLIWVWRPKMTLIVPVALVLIFALAPYSTKARMESLITPHGDADSNRFRVVVFQTGVQMATVHPWFGLGPGRIPQEFNSYVPATVKRPLPTGFYGHLHNFYIQYAAERGMPALGFILWFIGLATWDCAKGIARLRREKRSDQLFMLHGTIAVIAGILVGGLFEHNLGDSEILMMFSSVLGLAYAALMSLRTGTDRDKPDFSSNTGNEQRGGW